MVPLESLTPRLNFYGRKTDFETVILIHFFIRQTLEVLVEGAHSRLCQCTLSTDRHAKSIPSTLVDGRTDNSSKSLARRRRTDNFAKSLALEDGQTIIMPNTGTLEDGQTICQK